MERRLRGTWVGMISCGLGLALFFALLHVNRPSAALPQYQKRMLFLHGMQSRYQERSPAEIEAAARTYAQARGYDLEVLDISGDHVAQQEATARARIEKGGIDAVYGFSAGAYTADRLQKQFPNLEYIKVGASGVPGDIELPGVRHVDLPGALAGR
jgi:hypothetical protein